MDSNYTVDWVAHIKLAVVLSAIAVIAVVGLAAHIAEPTLIVGVIVVASLVAWGQADPAPSAEPARVHVRHR